MNSKIITEICVDSLESSIAAEKGGAGRLELCQNLIAGGTSPSLGLVELVREYIDIDVNVMVRPRSGDFCYSNFEMKVIKRDIKILKSTGINGIVIGILTPNGEVDMDKMRDVMRLSHPLPVTFHRAFDMVKDPFKALDDLIKLGVERILTSGQKNTAVEAIEIIGQLVKRAKDKIIIMPGSGINKGNVIEIIKNTGVKEIHLSAKKKIPSNMKYRNQEVKMGGNIVVPEFDNYFTHKDIVRDINKILMDFERENN